MSIRSDLSAFWDMIRGRPAPASSPIADAGADAAAGEQKALGIMLTPGGFVNEVYSPSSGLARGASTAQLEQIMSVNELVYACIHIKATSARDPRLIVQQQITDDRGQVAYHEIPGHPFRQLIMRPNPTMTESDLMQAVIVSWDVSNPRRFYAEKVYKNNLLAELWPLNPAAMTPSFARTPGRELIGYTWQAGGYRRDYSLDELLIRSAPPWYDPPPMLAARGSIGADTAQTETILTYFANGGVPPIFLKYSMALNDDQRQEIRDKWRSIYAGGQAPGEIGILDANTDLREIGSKLDQLGSQTLRGVSESRICMVFGVPPLIVYAYVGLMRATYSNLQEAWRGFWDATMSPEFKAIRDWLTISLLPEFENARDIRHELVRLNYDMSQVSALQEDVDAIQNRARSNYQARLISQNEGRAAIGYGPVDGGDDSYYSAQPMPATAPQKSRHVQKGMTPAVSSKAASAAARQRIQKRMERAVSRYLAAEYEAAAAAVTA